MHVKLKVLRGSSAGKEVVVRSDKFFIGRAQECHLRANSDAISRRHCAITATADQIAIRDLGSRNGTLVNGEKISGIHDLKVGDQLRVGPLEFLVTFVREIKPAKKTTASAAQKPAQGDDDDDMAGLIGDWLSEDNDAGQTQVMEAETREYRLEETDQIEVPKVEKSDDKEQAAKSTAEKKPHIRPTPSRSAKQAPKDTQEAAAQTLRKFFNRGG